MATQTGAKSRNAGLKASLTLESGAVTITENYGYASSPLLNNMLVIVEPPANPKDDDCCSEACRNMLTDAEDRSVHERESERVGAVVMVRKILQHGCVHERIAAGARKNRS